MRLATVPLAVVLSLSLSGCWLGKKTKTAVPPAPAPAPQQAKPAPPEVQPLPPEEKLPEQAPPEAQPAPMPPRPETKEPAQIASPAPKKKAPPRPAAKKNAPPTPAKPQPPQPAAQPPAQPSPPQLGEILSDQQRRQYEAEYAQSLARARAALRQASGKPLSRTQRETVERIGTFIQQAEESKGKDLATALQLARRADVLGQDLLKDFQ